MDKYTFILLMTLVVGLIIFGTTVALGEVKDSTSAGLKEIIGVIGDLAKFVAGGAAGMTIQKARSRNFPEDSNPSNPNIV